MSDWLPPARLTMVRFSNSFAASIWRWVHLSKRLSLLLIASSLLLAQVSLASAQSGTAGQSDSIRSFITDLNHGDVSAALAATAPSFRVTLAGGNTGSGAGARPLLAQLQTPVTIVSITPQGNHAVHTMLKFGSGPATEVDFTGDSSAAASKAGRLLTMTVGQVATTAATPGTTAPVPAAPTAPTTPAAGQAAPVSGWPLAIFIALSLVELALLVRVISAWRQ